VNGGRFRADAGTKAAFSQETVISGNGERARSLLCGREALDKPLGAADSLLNTCSLSICVRQREKEIHMSKNTSKGPSSSNPDNGGNWPSTTGNKSGGGRGNAPSRPKSGNGAAARR